MRTKNLHLFFRLAVFLSVFGFILPVYAQESIKVGLVLPLTGPQAYFGEMEKFAFEMALEEINQAGGVRGKQLEFIIKDDRSRPEAGVAAALELIETEKVVMLGGGYSSAVTARLAETADKKKIPFLVNTGSADEITTLGYDYVFRLNPTASEYLSSAVSFLKEIVKPKTIGLIYENTKFGQSQSKALKKVCQKLGIKPVVEESYDHADFKLWRIMQILLKVQYAQPDVVYMISYLTDASLLMRQAEALEMQPRLYLGGAGGFTMPGFYILSGRAAEKVMTVTLWHESLPYPGARKFFDTFKSKYNRSTDYHGAEAYAAAFVIADVLNRAQTLSPDHIRQALQQTDIMTVFGPVKFTAYDDKTNQNRLSTYLGQWIDGKLEIVWPEEQASKKFVYPIDWRRERSR